MLSRSLFLTSLWPFPVWRRTQLLRPRDPPFASPATEVALDLVVRDKKGRQVKNLKPGDVEIYEDGVRQQLLSFRMVSGREQESRQGPTRRSRRQAPALAAAAGIEHGLHCFSQYRSGDAAARHEIVKEFIKSNLPPESYIGIFNLNEKLVPGA